MRAGFGIITLALAGCAAAVPPVAGPQAPAFTAETVAVEPAQAPGRCWHSHARPALFETVTEQILVTPEERDASGAVTRPAAFRSETRQSELRPRQTVWFRIPCPEETAGPAFTATLQRALKARGLYGAAVSGEMDSATLEAVQAYQAANGLDSPVLSLAAGRALGLISVQ